MNNTVTLSQLITRLAKVADTDTNTSRRFLRTLFGAVEEALVAGESVTIKGIGTFRRSSDITFGSSTGLSFIPDEQLAKELNAPFEMFKAVELAYGVVFPEEKEETGNEQTPEPQTAAPTPEPEVLKTEPEPMPIPEPVAKSAEPEPAIVSKPEPVQPEAKPATTDTKPEEPHKAPWEMEEFRQKEAPHPLVKPREQPEKPVAPVFEIADNIDDDVVIPQKKSSSYLLWIGVAFMIGCGAFLGLFIANYLDDEEPVYNEDVTEDVTTPMIEEINVSDVPETGAETALPQTDPPATETQTGNSTAASAPATPAAEPPAPAVETPAEKEPRYDTVTKTNYLAQMARRYYGHATYWVFIYEANTDVLKNPNRISPGTRVRIPDESELPGTTSAERQKIASQKCAELERKYK